jgi:hypothetical protein
MVSTKDLHGGRRDDLRQCQLLWLAAFMVFLPVAFAARLTGWRWQPWSAGPAGYRSFIREADSAANRAVAITYAAH